MSVSETLSTAGAVSNALLLKAHRRATVVLESEQLTGSAQVIIGDTLTSGRLVTEVASVEDAVEETTITVDGPGYLRVRLAVAEEEGDSIDVAITEDDRVQQTLTTEEGVPVLEFRTSGLYLPGGTETIAAILADFESRIDALENPP